MFNISASSYRRSLTRVLAFGTISIVVACSDSSTSPGLVATTLTASAEVNGQTATVGQATPNTVSVIVQAQTGDPVAGATVTWTVVDGGGSVTNQTSTSDANGLATIGWTMGTVVGVNTLHATLGGGGEATITATAVAGAPASINIVSGNNQTISADSASTPFVVSVADQYGNMINGLNIVWTSNAGSLSTNTDATDSSGQATDVLTTDDSTNNYSVTATVNGLSAVFTVSTQ